MIRTMYDSVDAGAIPASATLIAPYVDGRETSHNYAEVRARFPHARLALITTTGRSLGAHVADVEAGDLSPASGAAWAKRKITAGGHPTLYCSLSAWPAVEAAVRAAGIAAGHVSYWIAHYDGSAAIPAGAIAVQYASPQVPAGHAGHSPGHYDVSAVAPYWAGVDPVPVAYGSAHAAHLAHLHHLHLLHQLHMQHDGGS